MKFFFALALAASIVCAQDERRLASPNGQVEFRLFVAVQESNNLPRLAYQVLYRGQPLVKTSFMGLDIEVQEPLLGETVGLTSSSVTNGTTYNSLLAKYMQNGSLGRLINVEARAYNDGVAFRYVIPPSTPLMEILIAEEATEFRVVDPGKVTITESNLGNYPPMRVDPLLEITRLARRYKGTTPLICPWRIISIAPAVIKVSRLLPFTLPAR